MIDCKGKTIESLFKPFTLNNLFIKNRVLMAPMTRKKSPNNELNDENVSYYKKRIKGGVGMIVTEGICIDSIGSFGYENTPSFCQRKSLDKWYELVDFAHQNNCRIFPQLWHVGSVRRVGMPPNIKDPSLAPSAIIHPYQTLQGENQYGKPSLPTAMTIDDIKRCIDDFVEASYLAKKIGFDGIELHAAHSYLIDQFFWSVTNKRTDQYGGDCLSQRTLFAEEIIAGIKQVCGHAFPISLRISHWKFGDFNAKDAYKPEILAHFLQNLVSAGVDIFHCSAHKFDKPDYPPSTLTYSGWVKKLSNLPTVAVGSIGLDKNFYESFNHIPTNIQPLDKIINMLDDECDLIALGRTLLADPEWPNKVKAGDFQSIVPFDPAYLK
ncbi:oxidoreductase [Facilibium subflavum]|uniref:oxidoreductase n=1 Tax=Facilibium subflavum TaxID=2219058 RepID=UPI000E65D6BB|nr:12-oxophytodienoate reductase [Facilibium subflavum]